MSIFPEKGAPVPDQPTLEEDASPKEVTSDSSAVSEEKSPSESDVNTTEPTSEPAVGIAPSVEPQITVTEPPQEIQTPTDQPVKTQYQLITEALQLRIGGVAAQSNFKVCLYGPPGGTKSSKLSQIPGNLVYDMEDGAISMKTQKYFTGKDIADGVRVMPFKSFRESELLIERLLAGDPAFDWVKCFSIDTFSDFHKRALSETVTHYHTQAPASVNRWKPETDHYTEVNQRLLEFVRNLRDLDRDIVITAHSRTVEPRGKAASTYPDFSESLANKIEAMMDIVAYIEMVEIEGNSVPVARVVSDGTTHAKTRIPLPPIVIDPQWSDWKATWEEWAKD